MRVALYTRVSTDDRGQDPLNQLLQLRDFAVRQGWTVTREYADAASAKNGERIGFKQLWADVEKHKFDLLRFFAKLGSDNGGFAWRPCANTVL